MQAIHPNQMAVRNDAARHWTPTAATWPAARTAVATPVAGRRVVVPGGPVWIETADKGKLTSQTAKAPPPGGGTALAFTQSVLGYDKNGQPTASNWSIPVGFGVPNAQNYSETYGYDAAGHVTTLARPDAAGLGAETVTATWNSVGLPQTLATNAATAGGQLVNSTSFDTLGRLTGRQWASSTGPQRSYGYDTLNRLTGITTTAAAVTAQNDTYTYATNSPDLAKITDNAAGNSGQKQCFNYDDYQRLTRAYTTINTGCGAFAAGGPQPYDQTWTFDKDNSIKTFTDTVPGASSTYTIGGTGQPVHATTAVTGTGAGTRSYDASGYLTSSTGTGAQTLTWDAQHQLSTDLKAGVTTRFVYGADGTRLIRQTPTETTLTLAGTDIVFPANGNAAKARRYYTLAGAQVALRDNTSGTTKKIWLAGDTQNSTSIAIDAATGAVTRTSYTPYGQPRTATPGTLGTGLPTDHGWLGKTLDNTTGLNHLDARYYDATQFTFTAPDPLTTPTDPRSSNPYTYAKGNPITFSDPSGLLTIGNCRAKCQPGAGDGTRRGANCPGDGGGGAGGGTEGADPPCSQCGGDGEVQKTSERAGHAKKKFEDAAKSILLGVADVTGLESIYDCATGPNVGDCVDAAITILTSSIGGELLRLGFRAFKRIGEISRIFELGSRLPGLYREWQAAARAAETGSDVVRYSPQVASRNLLNQVGDGYAVTPGGRTITAHAADRIVNGAAGRAPTTLERVDDILDNPTAIRYDSVLDAVRVSQDKAFVVVGGTGPQHIRTVMIP